MERWERCAASPRTVRGRKCAVGPGTERGDRFGAEPRLKRGGECESTEKREGKSNRQEW